MKKEKLEKTTEKVEELNALGLTEIETKKRIAEFKKIAEEAQSIGELEEANFWIKHYENVLK